MANKTTCNGTPHALPDLSLECPSLAQKKAARITMLPNILQHIPNKCKQISKADAFPSRFQKHPKVVFERITLSKNPEAVPCVYNILYHIMKSSCK